MLDECARPLEALGTPPSSCGHGALVIDRAMRACRDITAPQPIVEELAPRATSLQGERADPAGFVASNRANLHAML